MPNIEDEIRSKTEAFAADLAVLVRRAALEAAATALGGSVPATAAAPAKVAAKRGRPRKAAAPAAKAPAARSARATPVSNAASKAAVSRKAARRAPGEKRPPAELVKLTEKLGEYIKSNPGRRMESIGKALGLPTKELNLPVKKLLASKKIRSEGQKRATEYFPA